MESDAGITVVIALGLSMLLALGFTLLALRRFIVVCGPQEVLVLSGRQPRPRLVTRGRVVRVPIIEQLDRMDVTPLRFPVEVHGAFAKGSTRVHLELAAEVRVPVHDEGVLWNAIERFLGRSREEMTRVCAETLEGAVRGVVAEMTPEELRSDRHRFEEALMGAATDDLEKVGFHLVSVSVKHVREQGTPSFS